MLDATEITFIVIFTLEAVLIIIGNSLAILVFCTQNLRRQRPHLLLINLAVADLLVGIAEPLVLATENVPRMLAEPGQGRNIQSPTSTFQFFASSSSVLLLALISLERVYAVLWPLRHRVANLQVYVCSVLIVWFSGIVMTVLSLIPVFFRRANRVYFSVAILTCLSISLLIICVSYVKIRARLLVIPEGRVAHNTTERNLRLSKTILGVIVISLVFWLPAFVVYFARVFCPQCFSPLLKSFVKVLHLANSMVNPLVYTFRMQAFRNALGKLCRRK
ncbi:histamine H2 receptor-like [Montipora capricornis]|uniref:histamine H2 receptor-like n=1 Tax=Montipora capricornis TaxID=246305 RepID=UPI0035F208E6